MPTIALLYCVLLWSLGVLSIFECRKYGRPRWFAALNFASVVILILLFVGYWARGLVRGLGLLAPALFLFSIIWEVCTAHIDPVERRPVMKLLEAAFDLLLALPGFWFGGIAVWSEM